jgi:hypothetical protein
MYAPVPLEVEWKGLFERAREAFQVCNGFTEMILYEFEQ